MLLISPNPLSLSPKNLSGVLPEALDRENQHKRCLQCHQESDSAFWKKVREKRGEAKNNKIHRDILKGILRKAADK